MPLKTELGRNLDIAYSKVQYDIHCKKVLGNKRILAWIMKSLIPEYALLSPALGLAEKKRRLTEDYNIPMERHLEEEVNLMCNLSEYVEERGMQKGMRKGRQEGIELGIRALIETCRELGLPRGVALEKGMEKFGLNLSDAEEFMHRYWKE